MTTYISDKSSVRSFIGLPDDQQPTPVTEAQFLLFQSHFAGCTLTGVQEQCQDYMDNREQWLTEDEENGSISCGYCNAGVCVHPDGTEYWYETTSGTLLVVLFSPDGVDYFIHVPASRAGGHHHTQLGYILAGADNEVLLAGLNAYRDEDYKIWSEWYNCQRSTIPNWERINSYDTEMRQRAVDKLLQRIHSRAEAYVEEGGDVSFDMLLERIEETALAHPSQGLYEKYEEEVFVGDEENMV